jgi:cation diffusion facilitator CzcD-associated flavoprotein CzcO
VPGREVFRGVQHHTGLWPAEPVDFTGTRVAVVGTSSSGVQVVPTILDDVASITVYQRTANWCTPLNNRPITREEQAQLRAGFEDLRETVNTSLSGFAHPVNERVSSDESEAEHRALFEELWNSPGFMKLTSNYPDLLFNEALNDEWCAFIAEKIRGIVRDPETAERLIPKDHRFGGKRPPFVNGYFEAFNDPKVSLVDLRDTPIVQLTETGIETTDGVRDFDVIVWATGFDFGTGALNRMGIRGRDGLALTEHWADGPTTFLGLQTRGFPNFFFPGGPHAAAGNNPRYNGDLVDLVTDTLVYAREHGYDVIEVSAEAEARWTRMVDKGAAVTTFGTVGQYVGSNIPGKPRRYLLNTGGRLKLREISAQTVANDYDAYEMSRTSGETVAPTPSRSG